MPSNLVLKVVSEFGQVRPLRQVWNGHWQDIKELVRCDTSDFNREPVQGYRRHDWVYDGVAIDANEELASGLHSNLSPATDRWFELGVTADQKRAMQWDLQNNPDVLSWLELVADIIYEVMADPRTNFNPAMHEAYLDLGSFGTCVVNCEWDTDERHIVYKACALAEYYFSENNKGRVDRFWREWKWTRRQILKEFDATFLQANAPKLWKELEESKDEGKRYKMLWHVCPRTERIYGMVDAKNKAFASIYVCQDTNELLDESGYDSFPNMVSRWVKQADEVYGRGPAMKCLPDLKSLQVMSKVMLKAGQKAVDPPIVVPDDGFILPIETAPGSIIMKEPGAEEIQVLKFEGNVQFGQAQIDQKREYVRKCFYSEWLKRFKKNREQTATEVEDDRDEMLRFLSPMLGRQQTELLGPVIVRTYNLLHEHGLIPPAPGPLQKKTLAILYINPAARAQQGVKADRITRVIQDVIPLAQVNPDVMDAFDTDIMVQEYATARGVPRGILRSKDDIAAIRQQKAQAQQAAQIAQTAEPASAAIKNIAQAHALGGGQQ